jgi:hypothetical protein
MHLGVRLFIASSSIRDPFMKDYSALPASSQEEKQANKKYQTARKATRQDSWGVHGINSSADFLKMIFEDGGAPLEELPPTTADPTTTPPESTWGYPFWAIQEASSECTFQIKSQEKSEMGLFKVGYHEVSELNQLYPGAW